MGRNIGDLLVGSHLPRNFLKSTEFEEGIVKACVSSLPRWRYLRELERDPTKIKDVCDDAVNSDSDEEFEYVSEINTYRVLAGAIHIQFVPKKLKGSRERRKGYSTTLGRYCEARDLWQSY